MIRAGAPVAPTASNQTSGSHTTLSPSSVRCLFLSEKKLPSRRHGLATRLASKHRPARLTCCCPRRRSLPSPPVVLVPAGRRRRRRHRLLCFSPATCMQQCAPMVAAPRGVGRSSGATAVAPPVAARRQRAHRKEVLTPVAAKKLPVVAKKVCGSSKNSSPVPSSRRHRSKNARPVVAKTPPITTKMKKSM